MVWRTCGSCGRNLTCQAHCRGCAALRILGYVVIMAIAAAGLLVLKACSTPEHWESSQLYTLGGCIAPRSPLSL